MNLVILRTELTETLIDGFVREISEGLPIWYTCDLLGVPRNKCKEWMNQGEIDIDNGERTIYAQFLAMVRHAYAEYLRNAMRQIKNGDKVGIGNSWWLERVDPTFRINKEPEANVENITVNTKMRK